MLCLLQPRRCQQRCRQARLQIDTCTLKVKLCACMQVLDALSQMGMTQTMTLGVLRDLACTLAQGRSQDAGRLDSARLLLQQLDQTAQQGRRSTAAQETPDKQHKLPGEAVDMCVLATDHGLPAPTHCACAGTA